MSSALLVDQKPQRENYHCVFNIEEKTLTWILEEKYPEENIEEAVQRKLDKLRKLESQGF